MARRKEPKWDDEVTVAPGTRDLTRGAVGPDVAAAQAALGVEDLEVDGRFGDATEAAVKRHQRLRGIEESGRLDGALWAYLLPAITAQDQQPA